jgi:enoyl-CoA hydratase/carnithine racemase
VYGVTVVTSMRIRHLEARHVTHLRVISCVFNLPSPHNTTADFQNRAQRAPLSLQAMKRILDNFGPNLTAAGRAATDMERRQINSSQDVREGLQAFLERRTPIFRGV